MAKLKFIVASTGRFHVLDLARELAEMGHEVIFYSIVPSWRSIKYGLPKECIRSFFWWAIPIIFLERLTRGRLKQYLQYILARYVDYLTSKGLTRCDYFIGMSGLFPLAQAKAKFFFNATTVCERGSTHVLNQLSVLKKIKSKSTSLTKIVDAELRDYDVYDRIMVPSQQVAKTFFNYGVVQNKLLVNPYGVNFLDFNHSKINRKSVSANGDAIFVGLWGLRKGCDILHRLTIETDMTLTHVGSVDDYMLPKNGSKFNSLGVVDQKKLVACYARSSFLILLSREEGLALVQAQALACGLPVLCSQYTGGRDLKRLIAVPEAIVEVDINCFDSVLRGFEQIKCRYAELSGSDLIGPTGRQNLSWRGYAQRYLSAIGKI